MGCKNTDEQKVEERKQQLESKLSKAAKDELETLYKEIPWDHECIRTAYFLGYQRRMKDEEGDVN